MMWFTGLSKHVGKPSEKKKISLQIAILGVYTTLRHTQFTNRTIPTIVMQSTSQQCCTNGGDFNATLGTDLANAGRQKNSIGPSNRKAEPGATTGVHWSSEANLPVRLLSEVPDTMNPWCLGHHFQPDLEAGGFPRLATWILLRTVHWRIGRSQFQSFGTAVLASLQPVFVWLFLSPNSVGFWHPLLLDIHGTLPWGPDLWPVHLTWNLSFTGFFAREEDHSWYRYIGIFSYLMDWFGKFTKRSIFNEKIYGFL